MRIESSEDCGFGALPESVDVALLDLRATVGPKRGAMRRNGESGILTMLIEGQAVSRHDSGRGISRKA